MILCDLKGKKTMATKLNANLVNKIFMTCLYDDVNDTSTFIEVEGIFSNVRLNSTFLEEYKEKIQEMLKDLPNEFQENYGGGMSFLNACNDKEGNQWTGFHQTMEQLFQLGMAIEKVKCLFPREFWNVLPGGMPYYVVLS
jgi:hypothetical protein